MSWGVRFYLIIFRGRPESSSFSSMIITIVRGGRGSENDDEYHNFYYMRKVPLIDLRQKGFTVLVIYCPFDSCQIVVYVSSNSFVILIFLCYFLFLVTENDDIPAGIIDSAEAQMKLNLNEWVCMDMNVC